jgi:hypothetical protein
VWKGGKQYADGVMLSTSLLEAGGEVSDLLGGSFSLLVVIFEFRFPLLRCEFRIVEVCDIEMRTGCD